MRYDAGNCTANVETVTDLLYPDEQGLDQLRSHWGGRWGIIL